MKHKLLIIFSTLILFTTMCLIIQSCSSEIESPDTPKYTADQVIAVASAKYPTFHKTIQARYVIEETPTWEVEYIGDGTWMVYQYARHIRTGERYLFKGYAFYEANGKLEEIQE